MTPLAGLVLTGAPGRALADVVNHQVVSQIQGAPDGAQLIARYQELIRRFESGSPFVPDPALPAGVNNLVAALSAPANQPFTREFWAFRPAEYLGRIVEPVLVIIGKKDVQCDWQLDGAALEAAVAARTNVTFRYPEHANHILKHEPTPRAEIVLGTVGQGYNAAAATLDPETVDAILSWLGQHIR